MTAVRFAPSPTGYLHVGNTRQAVANFLFARRQGGRFVLRLDDTDQERNRPEFAEAIAHDLRWLGLDWDEMVRQSDRLDRYAEAAERLKASGRLYPCFESPEELKAKREMQIKRRMAPVYDRAMLRMTPEQRAAAEANGKRPYWRFLLSGGSAGWDDLVQGPRQVKLGSVSDPVVIRADGTPLYTFTSVVDDIEMGITHIIRGEDHVTNTGVQIDLFAALGATAANCRSAWKAYRCGRCARTASRHRRSRPIWRGWARPTILFPCLWRRWSMDSICPATGSRRRGSTSRNSCR
jgi:glutamyl-tRNA synthetase